MQHVFNPGASIPEPVRDLDAIADLFCRTPESIDTWSNDISTIVSDFETLHQMFVSLISSDGSGFENPRGVCSLSFRHYLKTVESQVRILFTTGVQIPIRCQNLLFIYDVVQVIADRYSEEEEVLIRPEWKDEPEVFLIAEAGNRLSGEIHSLQQWATIRESQFSRERSNGEWAELFDRSISGMRSLLSNQLIPNGDAKKSSNRGNIQIRRSALTEYRISLPEFDG